MSKRFLGFKVYEVDLKDLIFTWLVKLACILCSNFGTNYHCPPYTPTPEKAEEIISQFNHIYLVVAYYKIDDLVSRNIERGFTIPQALTLAFMAVDNSSYWHFNTLLRDMVKNLDSRHLILGAGGGCRVCSRLGMDCAALNNRPCRNPGKTFPSPESWGILVYETLKRLRIEFQNPPRTYITRVGILCTKQIIDISGNSSVELPMNEKLINTINEYSQRKYSKILERLQFQETLTVYDFNDRNSALNVCRNCNLNVFKHCQFLMKNIDKIHSDILFRDSKLHFFSSSSHFRYQEFNFEIRLRKFCIISH